MDTKTKKIKDFRGFENYVFKQLKIFGTRRNSKEISCVPEKPRVFLRIPKNQGDFYG